MDYIKEIKSTFTITGELRIETKDFEKDEKDFILDHIDSQLKKEGVKAFEIALTTKGIIREDANE